MGNVEAHCGNGGLDELEVVVVTEIYKSRGFLDVFFGGARSESMGGQLLSSLLLLKHRHQSAPCSWKNRCQCTEELGSCNPGV